MAVLFTCEKLIALIYRNSKGAKLKLLIKTTIKLRRHDHKNHYQCAAERVPP